jgi:Cytochrome c554 and c-prime
MSPICKWNIQLLAVLLLLSLSGCGSKSTERACVMVSADTKGWITPCGCAANQSGGLARRATLVQIERKSSDVLLLDAGGSALGTTEYQATRLRYLLQGLAKIQLDAHNIGGPETAFSPAQLVRLGEPSSIHWLGSNLLDKQGKSVASTCVEVTRGGLKFAIAGVVDPDLLESDHWEATEPKQAVLRAFKDRTADVRIVLAYFDEKGLQELADSLPEVDYIIGGPTGHALTPRKRGSVTILSSTNKGKFLASLTLRKSSDGFQEEQSKVVEVTSQLAESPEQIENLQKYYGELQQKDYAAADAGFVDVAVVSHAEQAIAGSVACVKCHQPDDLVWQHSKHSIAWQALVGKNAHYDPYCQQCHTTGYGQASGFSNVDLSRTLVGVGCENCHGPSQQHVDNPKKKTPYLAKQQCVRCHDHENSPTFEMSSYWAKVAHAGSKEQSKAEENSP